MLGKKLGIDLGTANSVVFVQGEGIAFVEPTVVAIDVNTFKVIAVGSEAKKMIGRNCMVSAKVKNRVGGFKHE